MIHDDLSLLEEEFELTSPLDRWEEQEPEPPPDPEVLLAVLRDDRHLSQDRMVAVRALDRKSTRLNSSHRT